MNPSKLAQLRSKTDRQLITVISRRLDAAWDYLRRGNYTQAEKAYAEANALLPRVDSLTQVERHHLESKLARLGETLEARTSRAGSQLQPAACL